MKKLLVFALLAASPAFAGRVDEIQIMTTEDVEFTLNLWQNRASYQITYQNFTTPSEGHDLAVQTKLVVNMPNQGNQEWTCVTQFVKTPRFFEITKTVCH
ncbi:hypothetical protein AB1A81_17560 [Bdellovibrio bacteriovorus]|uniref:Uncharacterized protein n=1 Tax=Bdellovibrio bacteriovorus (strain ATCC 15356 / DSM 50701 / NCIMB 9529 / HD100) TaxID=264462 RepID=Q6MGU5_BDEBA|nr:hypothetical protein [Bdellovibrio bacteriovorus]CAE81184.1 hypothetical protein predicted by Glimmer/Critica [Bdellovibrio bacteriovorus HD100]